jgi:hypothetical protein
MNWLINYLSLNFSIACVLLCSGEEHEFWSQTAWVLIKMQRIIPGSQEELEK